MKSTRYFLRVASVALAIITFASSLLLAQERIQVQPSGVMTWDQMRQIDAQQVNLPAAQRAIHSPLPGPGPREIGSLGSRVNQHGQGVTQQPLSPTSFSELPLTPMAVPTLSFDALLDNHTSIPPDTYGSVGPSHVMTMLNTQVRIQTKAGDTVSTVTLATFWTSIAGSKFDPKVNYDSSSGRWLAVVDANGNLATSKICFAISATSDPTGTWTFYEFDADAADATWADYPGFGHNATWIAITHNMFTVAGSPAFVGSKMWVIDKSTAVAGGALTTTVFATSFDVAGGFGGFTLQPCLTFGAEPTLYIVDNSGLSASGIFYIRISRITGTGPAPVWSVQPGSPFAGTGLFPVTNNFFFTQTDAPQSGIATLVETNDPRMLNAVFRNSRIWCTHSAALPVGGPSTRTAVFWYQLNPAAMPAPIVQSGVLDGGAGIHHFFPSISANTSDAACIGFSRSDATKFVEAVYSGRLPGDPLGTMPFGIAVFKVGESSYTKFFGGPRNRWGDYSNTCVDPSDGITFWTIQEYAGTKVGAGVDDGRWGTRWAKIVPPGDLPIQLSYLRAVTVQLSSVRVEWGTISETNNFGFYVQKQRQGELEWSEIPNSFVPGHGTTLEPQHYSYVDQSATPGRWYYRLRHIDLDGTVYYTEGVEVNVVTGVTESSVPTEFALRQNYPNPFNPSTTISFDLPASSNVKIEVFDMLGRKVSDVLNETKKAGTHQVKFDASDLTSGVYFYKLTSKDFSSINKMMLLR